MTYVVIRNSGTTLTPRAAKKDGRQLRKCDDDANLSSILSVASITCDGTAFIGTGTGERKNM